MNLDDQRLVTARRLIEEWCNDNFKFGFNPEDPIVRLHEPTFGSEEINSALDVMLSTFVTMGEKSRKFECDFSKLHDFQHGVLVNSGSSANLLAVASLSNSQYSHALSAGDEVIVSALSWSTTIWPLIQLGLIPVVVDIDPRTMNIDPNEINRALSPKTKAVMPVHVYGNPCDMKAIGDICQQHNLLLIEDCCEALGAEYDGKAVGGFGIVGTFSFYYSHHMTTLEGGICTTNDFELSELMRILRAHGWVRETQNRTEYESRYPHIDPKFLFVNLGYNLRATEIQGAFGAIQLPKLSGLVDKRRTNAMKWLEELEPWSNYFEVQKETPNAESSWFGLPMTIKQGVPFTVSELREHFRKDNIESRPIICGNISRQPAMQLYPHRVVGDLKHADHVMTHGFTFGNHHAIDEEAHKYVNNSIHNFLTSKGLA